MGKRSLARPQTNCYSYSTPKNPTLSGFDNRGPQPRRTHRRARSPIQKFRKWAKRQVLSIMEATQLWQAALNVLQQQVTRKEYETWLKTSSIADFDNGTVVVAMPNTFAVEWVENRIKPLVERT